MSRKYPIGYVITEEKLKIIEFYRVLSSTMEVKINVSDTGKH